MQKTFFFAVLFSFLLYIGVNNAYATETISGKDHDQSLITINPKTGEKTYSWSSHPERVLDNDGIWRDYIFTDTAQYLQIETGHGSVRLDKTSCSFGYYPKGRILNQSPLFTDSIIARMAVNGTDNWQNINAINSLACNVSWDGTSLEMQKSKPGTGTLFYRYKNINSEWKTELEAVNLSALTNRKFAFTQTIDLNRDTIRFGDTIRNIDSFDNQTFDRNWIITHRTQVLDLFNGVNFDFDLAFDRLWSISVYDTGQNSSKLAFDFANNSTILYPNGHRIYDPTFNALASSEQRVLSTGVGANCAALTGDSTGGTLTVSKVNLGSGCQMSWFEWNISTVPHGATVNSAYFEWDETTASSWVETCGLYAYSTRPSTLSTANKWSQGWAGQGAGTSGLCTTTGLNKQLTLNSTGISNLQANISGSENWWGAMFQAITPYDDATNRNFEMAASQARLNIVYTVGPPKAVTTLHSTDFTTTTVDLALSAPNLNGGTLQRYVFNYTTPCGIPTSALPNGTTATTYTVSNLVASTCYSFRASAATEGGYNVTGANIVNVTTLAFNQANYTIGSFNFQANNPLIFPIRYERIDSGTTTLVNVTFTNTFSLACDLRYTYAGTNHTYHSVSSIPVSTSEDEASFVFTNSSNDITTFHCWNELGNQSANYVLTQTDFLLKQQVRDFRNGTYGTMGQFGAFDLIALIVVIISMIGLNRNTEAVAGIFCVMAITVLAYFELVSWITAIVSAVCVVLLFMVAGTKKT